MRAIFKNFILFGAISFTLLVIGSSSAGEVRQARLEKPVKKRSVWFFNWFSRETGLISIANPQKGALNVFSLDDCINIAIKNHLPLQIANKNVKLAEMRLWESRRNMLPTVSARWEESYGKVDARRYVGKKEYIEGQQAVFHGGELFFTMKQAEVNLKIVKKDYERIKNDLILQVKKGYYTLAKAKENLGIQAELSDEVDKAFDMVARAFDAGVVSKLEFLNVSSQASQVKFQLASATGDESVAELILKQAMNVDSKEKIEIEPELEFKKFDIDFDETMKLAFRNRPEMLINSMMVDYYKYEKDIAKAKGWPKVDIMGSWGLAKEEYISEDNQPKADGTTDADRKLEQQWYAGFKASMPFWGSTTEYSVTKEQWVPVISTRHGTAATTQAVKFNLWDNFKYYSDKQSADIDLDRARQEFTKIKQDITLEVKEGCFNYEKALIQLETSSNKLKYQEKDLELTRLKRGMDEALDSNVIESMIKFAQERFGYIQALTDCRIAIAAVNKAIGVADYFKAEKPKE